jgi:hypothetical protein
MVAGFKSYLDFGSYHEEDFPTRLCEDVEQRVFAMVGNYVIPKLADPGQILVGAVETLISSGEVMQLINEIPGIDPQTFVNSLVHKKDDESDVWDDSDEGNGSPKTSESVPISSKGIELGLFIETIKNMYSWWEKIQGVTVADGANTSGLEFVDWVISRGLTALITVAQGGIACTVLATLALFLQMLLFYAHAHTKGLDLHRSVRKYFDPASGSYAPAIMDRVGSQRMRLPNVFDIISRDPEPSEVRTLMHLSQWADANYDTPASAGEVAPSCDSKDEVYRISKLRARGPDYNSKSDNAAKVGSHLKSTLSNLKTSHLADKLREDARKARSIDAQALRAHMVMSLQYRNLLSAPSFLGTYVFTIVFAFMIYFSLFFVLLVLPIQELFWITVWNFRNMWLSLAVLLIIKAVTDLIIERRLGMDKGQYSGISHPRMVSLFDGFKTIISCMIGWAPAIVRIISSVVATFILLPRLDFKLPGGVLDGSRLKYLGIIETWRLQMEYNAICTYDEDMRYRGEGMDETSDPVTDPVTTVLVDDGSARNARAVAFASTKATESAPEVTSLNPARNSVLERANL